MKSFAWQTAEYVHEEKSSDWYWTVGIITAALVIILFIFGNPLFGVILAIGVFTLAVFSARRPNVVSVRIDDKGVFIDKTLYPFTELESFSIDEDHRHGEHLLLKSKRVVMPMLSVPIKENDIDEIRDHISSKIPETPYKPSALHTIIDRLGF